MRNYPEVRFRAGCLRETIRPRALLFPALLNMRLHRFGPCVNIGLAGFPNATSGVFNAMFDLTGNATLVNGLNSGLAYVNIHSATFPAGEIRGQISVVPEPSTVLLMACGMIALGIAAGRRKSA